MGPPRSTSTRTTTRRFAARVFPIATTTQCVLGTGKEPITGVVWNCTIATRLLTPIPSVQSRFHRSRRRSAGRDSKASQRKLR
jgi:hypothetical protein